MLHKIVGHEDRNSVKNDVFQDQNFFALVFYFIFRLRYRLFYWLGGASGSVGAGGHKAMEARTQEYGKGVQGGSLARAQARERCEDERGGWQVAVLQVKKMRMSST